MTWALLFLLGLLIGLVFERIWSGVWDAVELYREQRRGDDE